MPVYNSMPYLTETLTSVLEQDLPEERLEVIAVDDGSTDGSGEELDRFAANHPRLTVIHQPNSGWPGMPRNRGLELASGDFVFFMDSDDTMAPDALRLMVEQATSDGADVVIPRMEGTGGRGVQSLFTKHPHGQISVARAMETISPQKLFRMSLIREHELRFPEGKVRLEDGMFVAKAYVAAQRIDIFTRRPLYFIAKRDDGQNISAQSFDPAGYDHSVRTIAGILREGTASARKGDRLVLQLFQRKGLRFYAPQRWQRMRPQRQEEWVRLHAAFMHELIPEGLELTADKMTDVKKMTLIRAGDVDGLRALITASVALKHRSRIERITLAAGRIELLVEIERPEQALGAQTDAVAGRVRVAGIAATVLNPVQRWRVGRGLVRRLEGLIAGDGPAFVMELAGRQKTKILSVPGRLRSVRENGRRLLVSFVVAQDALRSYSGDIVDAWTVAASDEGHSGDRVRITADPQAPWPSERGVRCYATVQGNFSLDLRKAT